MSKVLERALALMECFDEQRPSLPLQDVAARSGLAKPTAFRLLATLVKSGYVTQLSNQDYCLSPKLMRLAAVAQRTFSIRRVARPAMLDVLAATGETVDLSVLSGVNRVCVDVIESPHPLKSIISPGETVPLGAGASGKLLLAFNEDAILEAVLRDNSVSATPEALRRQLRSIRKNGFAHTRGERIEGVEAISVPLTDHTGAVRYCMTLTGPSFRFAGKRESYVRTVVEAGRRVSQGLGHAPGAVEDAA